MARVKVDLPDRYVFSTELRVRAADINYAGHLGNVQIIGLLDEARKRFFHWLGHKDGDLGGINTIMADVKAEFRNEGFWGDSIKVEVAIKDMTNKAFDVVYRLTNMANGKTVAIAKTALVAFDYKERSTGTIPESFKNRIDGL